MMLPAGDKVTSCKQSSAPKDGRNYRPKHVALIEITNKFLLLLLVGCLYYSVSKLKPTTRHANDDTGWSKTTSRILSVVNLNGSNTMCL